MTSRTKLGSVIRINPAGAPWWNARRSRSRGWEVSAEWRAAKQLSFSGSYAHTDGKTAATRGAPMDSALGARSQGPDKAATPWSMRLPPSTPAEGAWA